MCVIGKGIGGGRRDTLIRRGNGLVKIDPLTNSGINWQYMKCVLIQSEWRGDVPRGA